MEHNKHHASIFLALLSIVLISCTYLSVNDSPLNEQNHRSTTHQRQLTIVDPKTVHLRSSSPLIALVKSDVVVVDDQLAKAAAQIRGINHVH